MFIRGFLMVMLETEPGPIVAMGSGKLFSSNHGEFSTAVINCADEIQPT